ncbi:MAG: hypothetical protein ACRCRV_03680 [Cetobacterium sp.]
MFGLGRRSEMKDIESRTNSCVRDMQEYLEKIKNNLNETIRISQESEKPENNIVNQKEELFLEINKGKDLLEKFKAKIEIKDLNIAHEIALDDFQMGVSECEKIVYSLKNMEIPTSENIEDYFKEYSENYKIAMSSAKLAAGIGLAATGGVALGSTLTIAGLTTTGLVGTSLLGAGAFLGTIGSIAAGPIGWIIGGISLLGFLGSAPSKEEIIEAREKLYEIQDKREEIYKIYMETSTTLGKAEGVIRLSKNFTEMRKRLSSIYQRKLETMESTIEENLRENRIILQEEFRKILNEKLNIFVSYLYENYKNKKKFFCFRRKKTIWRFIEESENIGESFMYIEKYLRLPKEYKNISKNISVILENFSEENIEISSYFQRENSYEIMEDSLKSYLEILVERNLKITSPEAKESIKKVVDFLKLFKEIIKAPMINLEATKLELPQGVQKLIEEN